MQFKKTFTAFVTVMIIMPYTVFEQHVRVTLLAARFAILLLDMLAKLKGDTEISTNTSMSPISK